ncbi:putative glutamine ABC transporter permease protein GlnM [Oxobacter pfennigii]|uniref:Putative glutamine ABC transporter permease protein GlnM n=1 Tax=Oxobacter pfennigii TaxID=36849 RepID=A0A0N8NSL4_9CLOT|nr:amino acid ABC transporter permease [Oxobacter pfennigii]KPU42360.1 putative glutamine ABC transporter permease protein GlnM [Oxobacter pfennigii]
MKLLSIFIRQENNKETNLQRAVNIIIACGAFIVFFFWSMKRLNLSFDFSVLLDFKYRLFTGFITTIELSTISLLVSLLIGFLSAMGSKSKILPLSYFCKTYIQFIRGTPMIMQVYLFFYIIGTAWGISSRFIAGVLILSIFEGAYISEIIRGGLDSIDATQLEAAKAVGLDSKQTMRLVIFPQLIARILPALAGQFASIIKDSSLLSIISVIELTQTIREISATNFAIFECYLFLGLLYLSLTFPLSMVTRAVERRFKYDN